MVTFVTTQMAGRIYHINFDQVRYIEHLERGGTLVTFEQGHKITVDTAADDIVARANK